MRQPRATPNVAILAPLIAIAVVLLIGLMGTLISCSSEAAGCRLISPGSKIESS